jgi:hypothetical protein
MNPVLNGAQVDDVDEPLFTASTVVIFEFEAYPEPKVLTPIELQALYSQYKNYRAVGRLVGASEAFVRQNLLNPRKVDPD